MTTLSSDAFVFFGATGDLAYKEIFPALQGLIQRGKLDIPIIGVARAGWTVDQLRERARDSERGSMSTTHCSRQRLKGVGNALSDDGAPSILNLRTLHRTESSTILGRLRRCGVLK